jgi:hypothetical protein
VVPLVHPTPEMLYADASDKQGIDMAKPVMALDAYRDGELLLPLVYTLKHGADVLLLRRADGSVAAAFNAGKATSSEVEKDAWEGCKRTHEVTT